MCEQCLVNPHYYGEVLPGWFLIRARREGNDMKIGQWGLLEANDPTFMWNSPPKPVSEDDWYPDDFADCLYCSPAEGHRLVEAAKAKGYSEGNFTEWLFNYLGEWIRDHEPTTDTDPFPHLDAIKEHNYSLGKD